MTPEQFAASANVPRETLDRLRAMDQTLIDWSARHNLIAKSTMESRWERHYRDSAQLVELFPQAIPHLVDIGSGAGFPGLVLAAMLAPRGAHVTLIESTGKKAAFLTAAGEAMGLTNMTVENARIESVKLGKKPEIITARALARLDKLLNYSFGLSSKKTRFFFHKGQDVEDELTEATKYWHMDVKKHKSVTSADGVILEIGNLARVSKP